MSTSDTGLTRRGLLQGTLASGALGLTGVLAPTWTAQAADADFKAASGQTVYFRGWQFRTDVVQENVALYDKDLGGKVDYATVTGDYPSIMEKSLIAKSDLDVLYANPSSAVRYYEGGWILPASELPNGKEIADGMYPNIREAWSYKGKLLGLSYFVSTRGVMATNLEKFQAAGFTEADFPKNWTEFYDVLYKLRDKGIKQPYLPHWFGEYFGISWGFVFEVMNRGGQVANPETHLPTLTADGPAGQTLTAWKRIWKDGFVPEEVFTYNEAAYIDAYRSGRYIFSPQQIYDLQTFNDKTKSAAVAGHVTLLPCKGQSWGLIDSAIYMMTSRPRPDAATEDVKRFTSWYGYKNDKGEIAVGNRWMKENMLFSAYKSVMESEETKKIVTASLARPEDYATVLDVYAQTPFPKGIWSVVWAEEFNTWLKEKMFAFLQKDLAVDDTIQECNAKITQLNKKYKIK